MREDFSENDQEIIKNTLYTLIRQKLKNSF